MPSTKHSSLLFLVNVHTDPSDPISDLSCTHEGLQQVWYFPLSNDLFYLNIGSISIRYINETNKQKINGN